ncbi:MAG: glycosyltransferase family 39 protein [Thermoguttaceae bacterium]|nr:glycosyltransferase family 39 protein [Thermoguttaceae bacterium]
MFLRKRFPNPRQRAFWIRRESILLGLLICVATSCSASRLSLTWDEGDAFLRAASVSRWVEAFVVGPRNLRLDGAIADSMSEDYENYLRSLFAGVSSRDRLFSDEALRLGFPHAVCREGHPAGYSIALALGEWATSPFRAIVSEKLGFRIVGILLFSIALGLVYSRVALPFGRLAGITAALGVLFCPRVFAHAQIAGGDSLLISSWLVAWALFPRALLSKRGAILWGLALGVSFSAKFSGFLIVVPFAVALAFERFFSRDPFRRQFVRLSRFALGVFVGFVAFFVVNPTLWSRPIDGLLTFWELNTRRDGFNIPIYFFGSLYSPQRPLPWWNGFFWVAATTPVPILLTACYGAVFGLRRERKTIPPTDPSLFDYRRRLVFSALALGLTLPITRCFPGLPVHDGARLLIASCAFWGVLAGLGGATLLGYFWRPPIDAPGAFGAFPAPRRTRKALAVMCAALCLGVGAVDTIKSAPTYLSFYSASVGGVSGAFSRGFEPTYYWDALDEEAIETINAFSAKLRNAKRPTGVLFGSFSTETLDYYRRWKTFDANALATISDPGALLDLSKYGLYVVQFRPSGFSPLDVELMRSATPIYRKRVSAPIEFRLGTGKQRKEVVLLEIYDIEDVLRIVTTEDAPDDAPTND